MGHEVYNILTIIIPHTLHTWLLYLEIEYLNTMGQRIMPYLNAKFDTQSI